jgi:uncharacterized protein YwgA
VPKDTAFDQITMAFLDQDRNIPVRQAAAKKINKIQPGLMAIIEILSNLEKERYRWPIGRTSFQKIAYFATEYGLETGLEFKKSSFGPFAPEFKFYLTRLVNNGLIREDKLGNTFAISVGSTFPKARNQYEEYLRKHDDTIKRLSDLFQRLNTRQAEMAATIHYAATHLVDSAIGKPSEDDVYNAVLKWKERRRPMLNEDEIALYIREMAALGWLEVVPSEKLDVPDI